MRGCRQAGNNERWIDSPSNLETSMSETSNPGTAVSTAAATQEHVPVVICGAGPVGLATAIELSRFGVRSIVFERFPSTSTHPRARNINTRTMELVRGWGAEAHADMMALHLPPGWSQEMVFASTLSGEEYGRIRTRGFGGYGEGADSVSPDGPVLSSQDMFEPIFVRTARKSGLVDIRFGHEVTDVVDNGKSVQVTVTERANGAQHTLTAAYLIAADGAASRIRERMAIPMEGTRGVGHYVNVYFKADLDRWTAHRPAPMYWVGNAEQGGVVQSLDGRRRWLCQISYDGTPETFARYDKEACTQWIRKAVGDDSVAVEIVSVGNWTMSALVAEQLSSGRVFLVGDAVQQMPPTGGFGINTGFQGSHNLAWKMAYVLAGRADARLLDTYHTERRPIARYNTDNALGLARYVVAFTLAARGVHPEGMTPAEAVQKAWRYGNFLGVELGYRYDSATVTPDGTAAPEVDDPIIEYAPTARPGHRAPHLWIQGQGQRKSTLDLFGTDFTVLTSRGPSWRAAANTAAAQLNLGLRVHDLEAEAADFERVYGVAPGGAVLVRPDGHVAARWREAPADPASALGQALRRALGLVVGS
jgi:putative polyketide hydroxylase